MVLSPYKEEVYGKKICISLGQRDSHVSLIHNLIKVPEDYCRELHVVLLSIIVQKLELVRRTVARLLSRIQWYKHSMPFLGCFWQWRAFVEWNLHMCLPRHRIHFQRLFSRCLNCVVLSCCECLRKIQCPVDLLSVHRMAWQDHIAFHLRQQHVPDQPTSY